MTRYGDILEVSNSELQAFNDCMRRWWLTYHRGLRPRTVAPVGPLSIGSRVHRALEEGYSSPGRGEAALAVLAETIQADYPLAEELGDDVLKQFESEAELAVIMVEGFIEWAAEEGLDAGWEVVAQERVVKAPPIDVDGLMVILKGKLDQMVRRLMDGSLWMRDWKGQPCDGWVQTYSGPRQMGDIQVGDYVVGGDGRPTRVTATQDLGVVPTYRVKFSDGKYLDVTEEHLWQVETAGNTVVLSTADLMKRGVDFIDRNVRWPYRVPIMSGPMRRPKMDLAVDPYLLGLFLGDGSFADGRTASVCSTDDEIIEFMAPYTRRIHVDPRNGVRTCFLDKMTTSALAQMGLAGGLSYDKHVPRHYFGASPSQRLALLRGLMDSDGSCQKSRGRANAQSSFGTSSPQLRDDVIELVQGLGGQAQYRSTFNHRYQDGIGRDSWHVTVSSATFNPFKLKRKASVWSPVTLKRSIVDIEPLGPQPSKCIKVAASDGLYVAGRDFIVTHNTTQTMTPVMMAFGPQLKMYLLLLALTELTAQVSGGQFVFLKKVKRSTRANPPFYSVEPMYVSPREMESFYIATIAALRRLVEVTIKLEAGGDHRELVPARPTRDCAWRCPFYTICPMFDDGSDVERYIEMAYTVDDPYAYYGIDGSDKETE